jgi:hypothetical protein
MVSGSGVDSAIVKISRHPIELRKPSLTSAISRYDLLRQISRAFLRAVVLEDKTSKQINANLADEPLLAT